MSARHPYSLSHHPQKFPFLSYITRLSILSAICYQVQKVNPEHGWRAIEKLAGTLCKFLWSRYLLHTRQKHSLSKIEIYHFAFGSADVEHVTTYDCKIGYNHSLLKAPCLRQLKSNRTNWSVNTLLKLYHAVLQNNILHLGVSSPSQITAVSCAYQISDGIPR